jgi:hypothetical protein
MQLAALINAGTRNSALADMHEKESRLISLSYEAESA